MWDLGPGLVNLGGLSPRWGEQGSYCARACAGVSGAVPGLWDRVVPKPPQGLKAPVGDWGAGKPLTMEPEGFWGPSVGGQEGLELETWPLELGNLVVLRCGDWGSNSPRLWVSPPQTCGPGGPKAPRCGAGALATLGEGVSGF